MADGDCETCRRCGLRTCDVCGGVSFGSKWLVELDVCVGCRTAGAGEAPGSRERHGTRPADGITLRGRADNGTAAAGGGAASGASAPAGCLVPVVVRASG